MKILRGKKAIVTGAASGIGRAIALALAKEGVDLCLLDIDEDMLKVTAGEAGRLGVAVLPRACNLAEPAQVTAAVDALRSSWDHLDLLVNNAGVAYYGATHEMTAEQWNRMLAINLGAPIQLVRELLPLLAAQGEAHIVNVCSMFGLIPMRKGAAYQTSKFALVGLSASLRAEYGRHGIGVTALCPGFVRTGMLDMSWTGSSAQKRHSIPTWASTDADHVAAIAIRAIRADKGLVVITPTARLLWWLMRLSPSLVDWLVRQGWRRRKRLDIARS